MREGQHLRQRYRAIAAAVGQIAALVGILMLTPLLVIPAWPEEGRHAAAFLLPAVILIAGGLAAWRRLRAGEVSLSRQEGAVVVVLSWILASTAAAVPLMALEGLDFTRAVFEAVSGLTTTGLSVIDVERAHPMTLLWRSVMQLAGGAGLAILALAAVTEAGGPALSVAEGRSELLAPNVRASARLVVRIYAGYVVIGVLGLHAAGMGAFDAINHAFCAVSTGGFSTHSSGIGYFDSPAVESVTLVLMILGNLDFVTVWLIVRGRFRPFAANGEIRLFAVLLPLAAGLLLWLCCAPLYVGLGESIRVAVFEAASALTTTGYSTVGYSDWNAFGHLVLIVLMLIGGGACSTAGGIKQHRIYLFVRALKRELRRPFLPGSAVEDDTIWEGEERVPVDDARVRAAATFMFVYVATWLAGAAIFTAYGHSLQHSLFEFASTLGTVGLSVGLTGAGTPDPLLWTQSAGMLLGRLEFFVLLTGVSRCARDACRMLRPLPSVAAAPADPEATPTRARAGSPR